MVLARGEHITGRGNSACKNLEVGKSKKEQEGQGARVVQAERETDGVVSAESRAVACGRILYGLIHQGDDLGYKPQVTGETRRGFQTREKHGPFCSRFCKSENG